MIWWALRGALASKAAKFVLVMLFGLAIVASGCTMVATQTLQFLAAGSVRTGGTTQPAPDLGNTLLANRPDINPPTDAPVTSGRVTDVERYELALAAGFTAAEAVIATAISIAEDGSGDPAALSRQNTDLSHDLGLWQINSGWWPQFGGMAALTVPINNARAANVIYHRQGWCAWSTYGFPSTCFGIAGHNNAYATWLACAQQAAEGIQCKR